MHASSPCARGIHLNTDFHTACTECGYIPAPRTNTVNPSRYAEGETVVAQPSPERAREHELRERHEQWLQGLISSGEYLAVVAQEIARREILAADELLAVTLR
jgi:hypothetical protein